MSEKPSALLQGAWDTMHAVWCRRAPEVIEGRATEHEVYADMLREGTRHVLEAIAVDAIVDELLALDDDDERSEER